MDYCTQRGTDPDTSVGAHDDHYLENILFPLLPKDLGAKKSNIDTQANCTRITLKIDSREVFRQLHNTRRYRKVFNCRCVQLG